MEFINYLLHLKGVPTEDASWPENLENVQIFALQTSYVFSVNMYVAEVLLFFFSSNCSFSGRSHVGSLFPTKAENGLLMTY